MIFRRSAAAASVETLSIDHLRKEFLEPALFIDGELRLRWWEVDRTVLGAAVPTEKPLELGNPEGLRSEYFLERREMGIINLGGGGSVWADGVEHPMDRLDGLYLGRGVRAVRFVSRTPSDPARFWVLSYPAHASFPTRHVAHATLAGERMGARETANERTLFKYFYPGALQTCQLVMGFTRLESGNVWNTMPPHTHLRRSEVYLYFDLPKEHAVFHFMGEPSTTRHLVVRNLEAVLSPPWSIHCGCGTTHYSFVWGMGGENQAFTDMDRHPVGELR